MTDSSQIPHLPKPPRAWLTLLVGGVLVLSGMVMGAGGTVLLVKNRLEQPDQAPAHFSRRLAERMTRDMGLTSEQEMAIQEIFETHQDELHTVRKSVEERVNDSFNTMQSEVEAILTPEQVEIWSDRVERFNSRGERSGPPRREDGRMRDRMPPGEDFDGRMEGEPPHRERPRDGHLRDGKRPPPPRFDRPEDGERRPPRRLNEPGDHPPEDRRLEEPDRLAPEPRPEDVVGSEGTPPSSD